MTVKEAQEKVSSHEFAEWLAYYNISPFGEVRDDLNAANICQTLIAVNADSKTRVPTLGDCMLPLHEKKKQSEDEIVASFLRIAKVDESKLIEDIY